MIFVIQVIYYRILTQLTKNPCFKLNSVNVDALINLIYIFDVPDSLKIRPACIETSLVSPRWSLSSSHGLPFTQ